jgi:glycosyltransferase involved in cell wall biosynthesis
VYLAMTDFPERSGDGAIPYSPLVTVGLPVYNSERYVRQSLDSLLAQTYRDFTLVISDNASTDGTEQICRQYAATDSRVRYFRNAENIGNPRNFNRVFELASSLAAPKYLKWSTADDFWAPTFLERALEVMERDPAIALCYPQADFVDANGGSPRPYHDVLHLMQADPYERFKTLLERIVRAHQHLGLIRMSCLRNTHLLGTYMSSDITLLAELSLHGKYYELPETLFFRRFHETSGSWDRGNLAHDLKFYHPTGVKRPRLEKWKAYVGLYGAVNTAPLPWRTKMKCRDYLLRRMYWGRRELMTDLVYSFLPTRR